MSSTYSDRLRIELMAAGDQSGTWGDTTNTNLGTLIEEAIAGFSEITMSDANKTLSANNGATDEARQMILKFSGGSLTATRDIIIPSKEKLYVIHNATSGSQSLQIKTASSSSTVTIANGKTTVVYCDATDVFLAITNVPASNLSGAVAIANGGTGLTGAGSSNQVLTTNGSAFSLAQLTSSNLTTATANSLTPAGTIITFGGASAPAGYLACDGSAVSRTTYSALFSALSTAWGVGDGSSTFNVPDLRGAFLRGSGSQSYTNTYDGGSVGDKAIDQLRTHGHGWEARSHTGSSFRNNSEWIYIDGKTDYPDVSSIPTVTGETQKQQTGGATEDRLYVDVPQDVYGGSGVTHGTETIPFNASILYCIKT
jgi:microcystin-dependent protein